MSPDGGAVERAGRPPGAGRTRGQTGSLVLPGARQETALALVQLRRFHCGSQWKIHHEIVEVLDPASRDSFLDRTRIRHADGKNQVLDVRSCLPMLLFPFLRHLLLCFLQSLRTTLVEENLLRRLASVASAPCAICRNNVGYQAK